MSNPLSAASLFDLKDFVALVTGAGTGIGLMAAKTLAANGARVYITGRRMEKLEAAVREHGSKEALGSSGGELIAIQMDVDDKESIAKVYKEISSKEKYLNLLVNNAGISGARVDHSKVSGGIEALSKELFDFPMDQFESTFKTNVYSAYYVAAAFLPLMKAAKADEFGVPNCSIINISSISAFIKYSQNGQYSYNASKAAIRHLSNLMAFEFSRDDILIRVNDICPGWFPSQMTTGAPDEKGASAPMVEGMRDKNRVPAGRSGYDHEMGRLVLDLATNGYLWGQHIKIDGGKLLGWASE